MALADAVAGQGGEGGLAGSGGDAEAVGDDCREEHRLLRQQVDHPARRRIRSHYRYRPSLIDLLTEGCFSSQRQGR